MTTTITFSASKGGVGKTTMTFNFASYLIQRGYRVLLIDSCSSHQLMRATRIKIRCITSLQMVLRVLGQLVQV